MEKQIGRLLGLETELLLLDKQGNLSNRAEEIVKHPGNTGHIVPEFCQAMVETNPPPSVNIRELETSLHVELNTVRSIVSSLGITEVPLSEVGSGNQAWRNHSSPRYVLFEEVMGHAHCDKERSFCGTHLHVDHKCDIVGQYNLLQSMDPVFALMSTSSFVRGCNSVNCGRVNTFRNEMFPGTPQLNQLLNYVSTKDELGELERSRSEYFLSRLESTEENRKLFGGYNNGSTPLRKTEHTIEIRCADSNFPTLVIAMAALYKGVLEQAFEVNQLEIIVSPMDFEWRLTNSEMFLPSYRTLKVMESEGIAVGIQSQLVSCYLGYLLMVAERGLPLDEVEYLRPFKEILQHKRNVADLIRDKAEMIDSTATDKISMPSAALVNLSVAEWYQDDLSGGTRLVDMVRRGIN